MSVLRLEHPGPTPKVALPVLHFRGPAPEAMLTSSPITSTSSMTLKSCRPSRWASVPCRRRPLQNPWSKSSSVLRIPNSAISKSSSLKNPLVVLPFILKDLRCNFRLIKKMQYLWLQLRQQLYLDRLVLFSFLPVLKTCIFEGWGVQLNSTFALHRLSF